MHTDIYYFTFGLTHANPATGELLSQYWIEIEASSEEKARACMFENFGNKWGFQYTEHKFTRICHMFPKGCYARFDAA